jgi:hypothetical protein
MQEFDFLENHEKKMDFRCVMPENTLEGTVFMGSVKVPILGGGQYIRTVFLLHLAELLKLNELAEEMAVVLIHNCSSHITEA